MARASAADLLMAAGMPAAQARVLAAPLELAPPDALPGTVISRLPTIPIWGEISPEADIALNVYLDADSKWRYLADGPAAVFRLPKAGGLEILTAPIGKTGDLVASWTVAWSAPT
ncbi:MAG TPA: hypothetical protein VGF07_02005 [Stellaceae bacterium]|jgi:hypothetical protein